MTRIQAISQAQKLFDSGRFRETLSRRIAIPIFGGTFTYSRSPRVS